MDDLQECVYILEDDSDDTCEVKSEENKVSVIMADCLHTISQSLVGHKNFSQSFSTL